MLVAECPSAHGDCKILAGAGVEACVLVMLTLCVSSCGVCHGGCPGACADVTSLREQCSAAVDAMMASPALKLLINAKISPFAVLVTSMYASDTYASCRLSLQAAVIAGQLGQLPGQLGW